MKKLFLIRHAKSSWENPDLSDFERPLNNRGIQNAPVMAKRFIKKWNAPQILLCSPATRAKQTAEYFKYEFKHKTTEQISSELYEGSSSSIIRKISYISPEISNVAVISHNPNVTMLSNLLAQENIANVPTCGIVALRLECDTWKQLEVASCSLLDFDFPKRET